MKPSEQLETQRLLLRKPRMDDALPAFEGWTQDTEVTRCLTRYPSPSLPKYDKELLVVQNNLSIVFGEGVTK